MRRLISAKLAGNITLILLAILIIFHVLVLMRAIPHEIVWGGQISDVSSLVYFEGFAIMLTFIFALIIGIKTGHIKYVITRKLANIGVWLISAYFLINTTGNLASGITAEKMIFAPITILLTLLTFRLAIEK
jgi:hypothetical protein